MEDLNSIINALSKENNLERERVEKAIRMAVIQTAKKILHPPSTVFKGRFEVDLVSKQPAVYEVFEIIHDSRQLSDGFIFLKNAVEKSKRRDLRIGEKIEFRYDLSAFGRNGSELLSANIDRAIKEIKGQSLYFYYKAKIGEKIAAKVVHISEEDGTAILDINDEHIKAIIRQRDRIGDEIYRIGDWISAIIKYVLIDKDDKGAITLELSRTSPKFIESLLQLAIPEIKDGVVTVHNIARIPGKKAKVSLSSNNPKIDPVSAVIGAKGIRINSVSAEANNEIIDCITWSVIPDIYIKNSLSPAVIDSIKLTEEKNEQGETIQVAYVTLQPLERGKAIGKGGMNLKLAKMLTGYDIRLIDQNEEQKVETERKSSVQQVLGNLFKS